MKSILFAFFAAFLLLSNVATAQNQSVNPTTSQPASTLKPGTIVRVDPQTARINKLEEQNAKLAKDVEELNANLKALTSKFTELQKDNIAAKLAIVGLNNSMGTYKTDFNTLQNNFTSFKTNEYATHFHILNGVPGNATDGENIVIKKGSGDFSTLMKWVRKTGGPDNK